MHTLETNDMRDVVKRIAEGDEEAAKVREAFIYQICKDMGAMACVLDGKVDRIIVTGGIAYNQDVIEDMKAKQAGLLHLQYIQAKMNF